MTNLKHIHKLQWAMIIPLMLLTAIITSSPAKADTFKPTQKEQISVGEDAAKDILKEYKLINDKRFRRIDKIAQKLLEAVPEKQRAPWKWKFHLAESKNEENKDELNAFALPGGNIYILTGLYKKIKTDDELAAVLSHEMAHVYNEDWANMVRDATHRALIAEILLGVIGANKDWRSVSSLGLGLVNLKYSRRDEDDADAEAVKTLFNANYKPQGMIDLLLILKESGDGDTPEWLRSHPSTDSRIKKAKERIKKLEEQESDEVS